MTVVAFVAKGLIDMDKTAKILVTGGGGMVGRSLLASLRSSGFTAVLAPSSKQLDLRDQDATRRFFADHRIDYVFHLAGHIGGIGASVTFPVEFLYENLMIAVNCVHAARSGGVRKLLFLSSSCVYPRDCPQPMREDSILTGAFEPTNEGYAIAKVAAMKLCEYSNAQYGTNFLTLMPCNLYGYGDHFEPERSHVVSALMYKFRRAKETGAPSVGVWGSGTTRRELLFVTDLVDAMMRFMEKVDAKDIEGFVNVGLGEDIAIRDLAYLIKDIVSYSGTIEFDTSKPDGMPRKLMDVTRAAGLGWKAKIGIPEGLRLAYDWYTQNISIEEGVA